MIKNSAKNESTKLPKQTTGATLGKYRYILNGAPSCSKRKPYDIQLLTRWRPFYYGVGEHFAFIVINTLIMKIKPFLLAISLLIAASGVEANTLSNGFDKEKIARMTEEEKKARVEEIKTRVETIRGMDRSTLTRAERKALRHELRDLNKEARAIGNGGIYISLTGILLIILILILVL